MKQQILLDMDGVLVDFLSGALECLNRDFNRNVTIEEYADKFGLWGTYDYYGITTKEFWDSIHSTPDFWYNLKPMPWYKELYNFLSELGDVTIITTPSLDPSCAMQKLQWLDNYMGIKSDAVLLGSRKYLLAGNGILIDDYQVNVEKFKSAGGEAILIPSNWNTNGLTFERIKNTILNRE
jgi:5'(3')-deoxyribonucleotidase